MPLRRYRVVAFETVFVIWSDQVKSRGGGVAFLPLDAPDWPAVVQAIAREHFHHPTVRTAELGIANLDDLVLEQFCHRHAEAYWQGGDRP